VSSLKGSLPGPEISIKRREEKRREEKRREEKDRKGSKDNLTSCFAATTTRSILFIRI